MRFESEYRLFLLMRPNAVSKTGRCVISERRVISERCVISERRVISERCVISERRVISSSCVIFIQAGRPCAGPAVRVQSPCAVDVQGPGKHH